ncbi:MAG: NAD(P)-binding domain-containing protein [Actinomycetota bacterium]|nr:NAD(P)-binding domain-containing protein [Actinomycetota bacterium]
MTYRLGIIGCGNMGEALLKGIIDSDAVGLEEIIIYDKDSDRRSYLKSRYSVNLSDNLKDALDSKNILLAIKPQNLPEFIEQVKEVKLEDKNIISILAGIPTGYFEKSSAGFQLSGLCPIRQLWLNRVCW